MEEKEHSAAEEAGGQSAHSAEGAAREEDPIAALANYLGAFYESIRWDLALKKDSLRVTLQRSMFYAVFGVIAFCMGSAFFFSVVFSLVRGINLAFIELLSAPAWAVYISTSLFWILLLCGSLFLFFKWAQRSLLRTLNEKYERMRKELSKKKQRPHPAGDEVH